MGYGTYSVTASVARNATLTANNATNAEIFTARKLNTAMNPSGVLLRESRDSAEHPNSLAVILGLDVTGSMGSIPNFLVKEGLPAIMDKIMKGGEKDPQVMLVGIGDHECDNSPLQVGQFESSDELLDRWLKDIYLEGGGGGNAGESYLLAWYFAGFRTATDCFEKRGQKGILFTIGDEPTLKTLPKSKIKGIMGDGQYDNYTADELLNKARETYHVYHIHVQETASGSRPEVLNSWKQLLADNVLVAKNSKDIAGIIADTVLKHGTKTADVINTTTITTEDIL